MNKAVCNDICDYLIKAFEGTNAPYIDRVCSLSSHEIAWKISWWVQGIFEILEELINSGYCPEDGREEYLYQAIALLEQCE